MAAPLGQFVFGFMIAFAPAPLVGFATWSVVSTPEAHRAQFATPDWGAPPAREYSDHTDRVEYVEGETPHYGSPGYSASPGAGEMEIETDCKRRRKKAEPKPEPKPEPKREFPGL